MEEANSFVEKTVKKIYIAGPMRGIPEWNFPAFERVAKSWRNSGWQVFSPAAMDKTLGYEPNVEADRAHLSHVLLMDVASIVASDAIALLRGWRNSMGASMELAIAQFLLLDIYCAETGDLIYPPNMPWYDRGSNASAIP